MINKEKKEYLTPEMERFDARVEAGFDGSDTGSGDVIYTPIGEDTPPGGWGPAN